MTWLINADQLDKFRKTQKSLIILDASYHLAEEGRNAKAEFIEQHIADAIFFDLEAFSDPNNPLPHMLLLDPTWLNEKLGALGIRNDYKIICYDNSKLHSACRALWMFKVWGHHPNQLYWLDGGLAAWQRYGGKLESGDAPQASKHYNVHLQPQLIRHLEEIKKNLTTETEQLVDMRSAIRFAGGPEKRPGLRAGHIPHSICMPYTSFFDKEGYLKPLEKLKHLLAGINIDLSQPIISSCGSGVTAAVFDIVLDLLHHENHSLYDGSWSEWAAETLYPGEQSLTERPVTTVFDE